MALLVLPGYHVLSGLPWEVCESSSTSSLPYLLSIVVWCNWLLCCCKHVATLARIMSIISSWLVLLSLASVIFFGNTIWAVFILVCPSFVLLAPCHLLSNTLALCLQVTSQAQNNGQAQNQVKVSSQGQGQGQTTTIIQPSQTHSGQQFIVTSK